MKPQKINIANQFLLCFTEPIGTDTWVSVNGESYKIENVGVNRLKSKNTVTATNGDIFAPMPGQILNVLVKNKQQVQEGDALFVVEAMKMEHTLKAPCSGQVTDLNFKTGDTVTGSDIILKVKTEEN